jgi:ribonuclease HI
VSRRKKEPDAPTLLRFIAEHESLSLTGDEFPYVTDERIRAILREVAKGLEPQKPVLPVRPSRLEAAASTSSKRVVIHTDGASRGNPGPAGAGWIISAPGGEVLGEGGAFLGKKTNNEAEYEAVIRALKAAQKLGADEVMLHSDSELLIKQLNGDYQVKNARIAVLHAAARDAMRGFRQVRAAHVRREQNSAADAMANEAIDGAPTQARHP